MSMNESQSDDENSMLEGLFLIIAQCAKSNNFTHDYVNFVQSIIGIPFRDSHFDEEKFGSDVSLFERKREGTVSFFSF